MLAALRRLAASRELIDPRHEALATMKITRPVDGALLHPPAARAAHRRPRARPDRLALAARALVASHAHFDRCARRAGRRLGDRGLPLRSRPTTRGAASSTSPATSPARSTPASTTTSRRPRTGTNGRHPLPSVAALAATFGRLGIGNDTQVVAYDQDAGTLRQPPVVVAALRRATSRGGARRRLGEMDGRRPSGAAGRGNACRRHVPAVSDRGLVLTARRGRTPARGRPHAARRRSRGGAVRRPLGDHRQGGWPHPGRAQPLLPRQPGADGTLLPPDALRAAFTRRARGPGASTTW